MAVSLRTKVHDPGFTPGKRDVAELLQLLSTDREGPLALRALVRYEGLASLLLLPTLPGHETLTAVARARFLRAVGRALPPETTRKAFIAALADSEERVKREAVVQLGKGVFDAVVEQTLLTLGDERKDDTADSLRGATYKAILEALGKIGSAASRDFLQNARTSESASVAKQASQRLERVFAREVSVAINEDAELAAPLWLRCRKGLELLAQAEAPQQFSPSLVKAETIELSPPKVKGKNAERSLRAALQSRLWFEAAFPLGQFTEHSATKQAAEHALLKATQTELFARILQVHAPGVQRYRIEWPGKARQSEARVRVVEQLRERFPSFVNDPRESQWELRVQESGHVSLRLRKVSDARFAYRVATVPASSHPTIAAALAWVASPTATDVVWDPFVGAGAELRECSIRTLSRKYLGSDTSPEALEMAKQNLEGLANVHLEVADATRFGPSDVSLIITNPPMGIRVERHADLRLKLSTFMRHAYRVLVPGGRLVWLAPSPRELRAMGLRLGLELVHARLVDMGGYDAELQHWKKSEAV
jgi:23S rRNA G2445 N2-methylase RlmL/HEAT repeat protein